MYDDDFKIGNHDDHFSNLNDLIAFGLQEFDSYADAHAYSCNNRALALLGLCTSDAL